MAKSVASFGVSLYAKTSAFRKGMKKARGNLKKFGRMASKVSGQMAKFGSILTGVATGAMALSIKNSLKNIDALAKLSARVGMSVSDFQKLQHAASLSGASAELMAQSMDVLSKRLGEAAMGTGEAKGAIEKLGMSVNELLQMKPADRFKKIADAVSLLSTQEEKAAVTSKLFSRAGLALVNVLDQGSAGIEKMGDELKRTGSLLSDLAAHKVEMANDAISRMMQSIQGLRDSMAVQFASTIQKVSEAITGFTMQLRAMDQHSIDAAKSFFRWTAALTAGLVIVPKLITAIVTIVKGMKALAVGSATLWALSGPAGWATLAGSLVVAGGAVWALNTKFNNLTAGIKASVSEAQKLGASVVGRGMGLFGRVATFRGDLPSLPGGAAGGGAGGGVASAMASRAKAVFDATREPMERFRTKMKELNALVKEGAIDWDTFARARIAAIRAVGISDAAKAMIAKYMKVPVTEGVAARVTPPSAGAISLARTSLGGAGGLKVQKVAEANSGEIVSLLREQLQALQNGQGAGAVVG